MALVRSRWLRHVADRTVDLLFPANCLACHQPIAEVADQISFCSRCRQVMGWGNWQTCRRCASRVPKIPGAVEECARCRGQKLWFERSMALGEYDGLLRDQLLLMKSDRSERLARSLGLLMATRLGEELRALQLDAIVPVPLHIRRRLVRGTHPPAALSAVLGRELGLPMFSRLLRRRNYTQSQAGLSQPARFLNVRNAMQLKSSYRLESPHVLLVDDILTTGATCSEAARMLKRAGAAEVSVLVVARTPSE